MRTSERKRLPVWMLISALLIGMLIPILDVNPGYAESDDATRSAQSKQTTDYLAWAYPDGIEAYKDAPFVPGEILVGYHGDQVAAAGLQSQLGLQVVDSMDLRGLDGSTGDAGVAGYVMRVPSGIGMDIDRTAVGGSVSRLCHPQLDGLGSRDLCA